MVTIYLHVAPSPGRHITSISISLKCYHLSSILSTSYFYKFDPHPLVQDDLQRRMLLRGAYGLSPRSLIGCHLLQLTASCWTTEASTSERWQRWSLDWTWIGLDPDCSKFCWIRIGSGLWNSSKFKVWTGIGLSQRKRNVAFLLWKGWIFRIFWTKFGHGLYISRKFLDCVWTWTEFKKIRTGSENTTVCSSLKDGNSGH